MEKTRLFDSHAHLAALSEASHFVIISGYSPQSNLDILQRFSSPINEIPSTHPASKASGNFPPPGEIPSTHPTQPISENFSPSKNVHHGAYFTLGLGPQEIQRQDIYPNLENAITDIKMQVESALSNPLLKNKFVGIGEVGLDKHWGKYPKEREIQFHAFEKMILLSKEKNLPLVIHSRDAEGECIRQLSTAGCKKAIMHCFGGNLQQARQAVDLGYPVSIPPVPSSDRKKIIKDLPLESLVVESDAPYIGKKSSDAMKAVEMISRYKEIPIERALLQTFENAKMFYGIS